MSPNPPPTKLIQASPPPPSDELDLAAILANLIESWKLILAVTAVFVIGAGIYAFGARPIYSADSLVQVEKSGNVFSGLSKDMADMFPATSPAETEIQILRSRSVLGAVAEQLKLDISADPLRFPFIGGMVSRHWEKSHDGLNHPWMGLTGYGWGGERIDVGRLELPRRLEDKPLTIVAKVAGAYDLLAPDGAWILRGKVGQPAVGQGNLPISIFIGELTANAGTRFQVVKHSRVAAMAGLRGAFSAAEQGENTGIIQLSFKGSDPDSTVRVLDAIDDAYLRQNVEQKSAEADKTLQFVTGQLPEFREQLDQAETALNAYQTSSGNIDLSTETKSMLQRDVELEKSISELELQRSELLQKFTPQHPMIVALNAKMTQLQSRREQLGSQLKMLPDAELREVKLMRDVQVSNQMYMLLLNKAQELKIVKSGTVGNVRILDSAAVDASAPVWPNKRSIVFMGLVLGLAMGIAAASAKRALHRGIDDPEAVEQAVGLPVYATIPHSNRLSARVRHLKRLGEKAVPLLTTIDSKDLALESLRSLRTSLQFALTDATARVLLIAGLRPEVGKSFVSANLAQVMGAAGKKVLLVDGDLRRGILHSYFGCNRDAGLSEVASGTLEIAKAIRPTPVENVALLTTGVLPPNPSELLLGERFRDAMKWASGNYDLVIVDAPPILAVTDASIIGAQAGVTLLVLKAGVHPPREVALGISRFDQNGLRVHGAVLNDMVQQFGGYAYYGKYGYSYSYDYRNGKT